MIVKPGIPDNLRWFSEARFGMFVHFGIYSELGRGEWVMYKEKIPFAEYSKLADTFNPHRFDADEWVEFAAGCGARYICCTAKHHDGFCLFDTTTTEYKITNTPFGRDLIGELIDACHRHGMRIIIYYSQPDWHHKNYVNNKGAFKDLDYTPEGQEPDWDKYIEYMFIQVRELCSNYGKIDGIFFDGSHKTVEEWRGRELYAMIKSYNPDCVVNDRARYGDYYTPERAITDEIDSSLAHRYMLEICNSVMRRAWGYADTDDFFSPAALIRQMLKAARIGCNYLLNVGPAPDGRIPEKQKEIWRAIGRWMQSRGEAYIGTVPVELKLPDEIVPLLGGNRLYLCLTEWPENTVLRFAAPHGMADAVIGCRLLPGGSELKVYPDGEELCIVLPPLPYDVLPQVIALELSDVSFIEPCKPTEPEQPRHVAMCGNTARLTPETAIFEGYGVKGRRLRVAKKRTAELADSALQTAGADYAQPAGRSGNWITDWMTPDQSAVWLLDTEKGKVLNFRVEVKAGEDFSGTRVKIDAGDESISAALPEGKGIYTVDLGSLTASEDCLRITLSAPVLKWGYHYPSIGDVTITEQ